MLRLVCLLAAVAAVSAHKYGIGKCATVRPMEEFDAEGMLGLWYLHHAFSTTSNCVTFNYTRGDGALKVTETKELRALDAIGLDHKYTTVGTLRPDGPPGQYTAKYTTNPVSSRYIVMTTDYNNYAGVYHCQHLAGIVHRRNVYILSRTPSIDDIFVEKVKRRMSVFDLNPEDFEPVRHQECTPKEESDVNVRFDGSLFNFSEEP